MSNTEVLILKEQMKEIKDSFQEMRKENQEAHKDLLVYMEKAIETRAAKWVEDALKWGIGLVMSIVISAIVYLVIKQ